jgi:hypothetical protein
LIAPRKLALAEDLYDPKAKCAMFEVAERHELIAKRGEARVAGVALPADKSPSMQWIMALKSW